MSDDDGDSLLEWLLPVWTRRKWYAIIAVLTILAASVTFALSLPDVYQSGVTVLIERPQVPETLIKPTVTGELETRLQALTQEILSRARLEALITTFDLYPQLRDRASPAALAERLRRDIGLELKSVDRRDRGDVTTVSFNVLFRGRDPQKVADVANALAGLYVEENTRRRQHQAAAAADLLGIEIAETKKRLDEQERQVGEFKNQHFGGLPEQYQANVLALDRLRTELRLNREMQMKALDRRDIMEQVVRIDTGTPGTPTEPGVARLARLRQELAEMRRAYSEKYPDVIRLQGEIAELEREVARAAAQPPGAAAARPDEARRMLPLRQADAELRSLKGEEQRLRADVAALEQRVAEGPRREQELSRLTRDHEATKEYYRSLLSRLGDARLGETTEERRRGEQFRILEAAVPAMQPIAPRRVRLLIMGAIVSIVAGAVIILAAEQIDTSFHSVRDLRAASSLPVAAAIPLIVTATERRRRRWRVRTVCASATVGIAVIVTASFLVAHDNERMVIGQKPVVSVDAH